MARKLMNWPGTYAGKATVEGGISMFLPVVVVFSSKVQMRPGRRNCGLALPGLKCPAPTSAGVNIIPWAIGLCISE
jgi:hypothetical protein